MKPGWYPDPWKVGTFRWWDGSAWTANIAVPRGSRAPRLASWLSVPVLLGAVVVVPAVIAALVLEPASVLLTVVPIAIVAPVLIWIDQVEPEPVGARIHALLWGATISIAVAGTVNSAVAIGVGESAAAVISAPLVEEFMKGLGVVWMVRRRELDSVTDGLVYAGWVGLGFAMVENVEYFVAASDDGVLAETFVLRALVTPFAHPLFTLWIGWAVGWAVARRRNVRRAAIGGGLVAVGLHAAWNGSLVATASSGTLAILMIAALVFLGIFIATSLMVVIVLRRERERYIRGVGPILLRYGLGPDTVPLTASWGEMQQIRRHLDRDQRRSLDRRRAAVARLVALHDRPGPVDPIEEIRLMAQITEARR